MRTANVKDGYALQLAVKKGYRIAVISGGTSDAIVTRLHNLKINDVFIKVDHKIKVYKEYLKKSTTSFQKRFYLWATIFLIFKS